MKSYRPNTSRRNYPHTPPSSPSSPSGIANGRSKIYLIKIYVSVDIIQHVFRKPPIVEVSMAPVLPQQDVPLVPSVPAQLPHPPPSPPARETMIESESKPMSATARKVGGCLVADVLRVILRK